ncbi:MAG: exonuclease domain-containing protein [Bacteroidaceae bacterium]|nr:exonuclease domain-containing protein [Bacteroidaceae bacterium]
MDFIIFDLEFNRFLSPEDSSVKPAKHFPFEIIQLGAVKLSNGFSEITEFVRLIKPSLYKEIDPFITQLTGITLEKIQNEALFPTVLEEFASFIGSNDPVFCVWGMSDVKELYRSSSRFGFDNNLLPWKTIDVQRHAALSLGLPRRLLPSLQSAVAALNIPIKDKFHDALFDARYTAEVLKMIYSPSIKPKKYDPSDERSVLRRPKREIDIEGLLNQFEKMYGRDMSNEERQIIVLAYKMGRTHQFLKEPEQSSVTIPDD